MSGEVRKIDLTIPVSAEVLRQHGLIPDDRSDEEKAAEAQRFQELRARGRWERYQVEARHEAAVAAADDPFRRAVLELHAPVFPYDDFPEAECHGCDGFVEDRPSFPCRTYELAIAP